MLPKDQSAQSSDNQLPSPVPGNSDQPDDPQTPVGKPVTDDTDASEEKRLATHHLSAEDLDLIEKEWVMKAKEVVDHTQGDPYLQSRELNKIKADYIKKRYNRDIKPNE